MLFKLDENADEKTDAENAEWKNTLDFLGINKPVIEREMERRMGRG